MEKRRAKITALGHFLPDTILSNKDLEKMVETNDEWIRSRTGISERRILDDPDKATSYMATETAKEILSNRGIDADEIDMVLVATVTPDYLFPATSCIVQQQIGAHKAFSFDVLAACSGFLYALSTGAAYIEAGRANKVLVIGADKMSSIIDFEDRSTCILFGDAGAGVLLEASEDEYGIIDFKNYTEGDLNCSLCQPAGGSKNPASQATIEQKMHFVKQDGRAVFKKAVEEMSSIVLEMMERNHLTSDDITWLVPHQANKRIIDATKNRVHLLDEKVMVNIQRYGNTTAGTIPLCLYEWQDKMKKGDQVILSAFGGGFTWGAAYLTWGI